MLLNTLKIAVKVLLRHPFLTFVNLFGVVLTLTVLIVASAVFEHVLNPRGAERRHAHFLTVDDVCLHSEDRSSTWNSGPGWKLYTGYIEPLETPDRTSFFASPSLAASYVDGTKIESYLRRTDAAYWDILAFDFVAGRAIGADDYAAGRFVAVINEATRRRFFGSESALGRTLTLSGQTFTVIGVVADESRLDELAFADVWVPLTTSPSSGYRDEWLSSTAALLWVDDPGRRDAVQREFRAALERFEYTDDPELYTRAKAIPATRLDYVAGEIMGSWCTGEAPTGKFAGAAVAAALAFMLLPAVNMINLNVSRILERAPEIGLRKAAGATRRALVGQFIVENLVLTAFGGIIAFAVAPWLLGLLNETIVAYGDLSLNVPVFFVGLVLIAVFGVLSGAYPAWKMARLDPAVALRGAVSHA